MKKMKCACCDHESQAMYLHPKCHPDAGTWSYFSEPNFLTVECKDCRKHVVTMKVETYPTGDPVFFDRPVSTTK